VIAIGHGGHVHYFGAGTSGRLAVLDAYECPPTFDVAPTVVQAHLAGGNEAFAHEMESVEDDAERGAADALAAGLGHGDVAVGVAASGNTPYVIGALQQAAGLGAETVALVCARGGALERMARHVIAVEVGPEVVGGSTRLKAGTAQKLVLNMLSTATFTKLGYIYDGLMVAVRPANTKLQMRAVAIIQRITGAGDASAQAMLVASGMDVRVAIVALARQLGPDEARERLARTSGNLRLALAS
jgi:N-acetylmuramic acid 6-phosphate etherase